MSSAVALFAKAPRLGRVKTRLAAEIGDQAALNLYLALLNDWWRWSEFCRSHSIDFYLYLTGDWQPAVAPLPAVAIREQSNGDLGERMYTALQALCREYRRAIIVGADLAGLPHHYLTRAIAELDQHDGVIGPASDGGYYLIGCKSASIARISILFREMAWSTETVLAETLSRAQAAAISLAQLPEWYDIDTGADLNRLRSDLNNRSIDPDQCPNVVNWLNDHQES